MAYESIFQPRSYDFSHESLNDDNELEYTHTDGQLRVTAKLLMMEQRREDVMPHRRADVDRELGHLVFEMAYRSGHMDEYIQMHNEAVTLEAA